MAWSFQITTHTSLTSSDWLDVEVERYRGQNVDRPVLVQLRANADGLEIRDYITPQVVEDLVGVARLIVRDWRRGVDRVRDDVPRSR